MAWSSPTGFAEGGGVWTSEALAYDENTSTYAYASALKGGWTDYLELNHDALDCDKVQVWVGVLIANISAIEVDVYYGGAWHNIYSGAITVGQFVDYPIGSTQSVIALRVRFYSTKAVTAGCMVHEADFNEVVAAPDITNLPNNQDFGIVLESSTPETGLTYFTVTNNSGGAVTIFISGTDATGGTTHTLSDTATPGNNIFGLKAGLEGGDYTIVVRKTEAFNTLVSGLAPEGTQKWGLKLYTPTTYTNEDAQKTSTVTLSVILD